MVKDNFTDLQKTYVAVCMCLFVSGSKQNKRAFELILFGKIIMTIDKKFKRLAKKFSSKESRVLLFASESISRTD